MPRQQIITKAAISRAVKGMRDAGIKIGRVEIEGGKIVVYSSDEVRQEPTTLLDGWKAKRDAR